MSAEQSLREGDLDLARAQLQDQVRKDPSNAKHRIFLFQLLAVTGDWARALTQLQVVAELDASALMMAQMYREALSCEALRAEVFAGQRTPVLFGDPEQWVALLMEALRLTAAGEHSRARDVRDEAFEAAPATSGKIDDKPFEWIADADSRLGPVLEAIVNGRYYWVPFSRIRALVVEAPADLRDFVWAPVHFTWTNGGQTVGLIPTRYPGSQDSADDLIRLGRKTAWDEMDGVYFGQGQRMLTTDAGDHPLLDVRLLTLDAE